MRTLRLKALVGLVGIFLALAATGSFVFLEYRHSFHASIARLADIRATREQFNRIPAEKLPLLERSARLLTSAQEVRHEMLLFAINETEEPDRLAAAMEVLNRQGAELQALWFDGLDERPLKTLRGSILVVDAIAEDVMSIRSPVQRAELVEEIYVELDVLIREVRAIYEQVGSAARNSVIAANRSITSDAHAIGDTLRGMSARLEVAMMAFLFVSIMTFAIVTLFGRALTRRFGILQRAMGRIGGGDVSAHLPVADPPDELDELSANINAMIDRLAHTADGLRDSRESHKRIASLLATALEDRPLEELLDLALSITLSDSRFSLQKKGAIFLADPDTGVLRLVVERGLSDELLVRCAEIPFGRCLCGRAAATRELVFAGHVDARHEIGFDGMRGHGHYCAPILSGEQLLGVLNLYVAEGFERASEVEEYLVAITRVLAAVIARKQVDAELVQAKEAAEEANSSKSDFLSNMSHEIRTPMNAVIGMTHLMLRTELNDKQYDYLAKIQSSAQSLLGIINDILDFSKIEAGKLDMERIAFDLEDVLEKLAGTLSIRAEEKGLEFLFSLPEEIPRHLIGDPLRLQQVLLNLANNAVKFTDQGEICVFCRVERREAQRVLLRFSVRDTGIGLTREQAGRLFQAFGQADTSTTRRYGGTGLGLSICKRLVEMMNGEIGVTSEPDVGSTFSFSAWFGLREQAPPSHALLASDLRDMRVLVVDDNANSRTIFCDMLGSFSFDCRAVDSGDAALEAMAEAVTGVDPEPFELLVMDWKMPGMGGLELARRIRETPRLGTPTIILATAYGREEIVDEAERDTIDAFLAKPASPSQLLDIIMTLFGNKEPARPQARKPLRDVDAIRSILGAKVLLAEDNAINQQVAMELLEGYGLIVTLANDGAEAVKKIREDDFDVVLMDIQMPGMDGLEATREIRKDPRFKEMPILAMTAHAMVGDREQCLAAGMDDHVTKPIDPDRLFEALAKWIPDKPRAVPQESSRARRSVHAELPERLPGIDLATGLARVRGNRKLFKKLLQEFRRDYLDVVIRIRQDLRAGDEATARREAHTLKGLSGTIGAAALQAAALALETAIDSTDQTDYQECLDRLEDELTPLLQGIAALADDDQGQASATEASSEVAAEPIDPERLARLFDDLAGLLDAGLSKANDKLDEIAELVGQGGHDAELAKLRELVDDFEFDEALEVLPGLASAFGLPQNGSRGRG